ncbi:MAG: hypothetical protein FXF47_03300 [Candidatus Mcinerneyibacterium aminivorans]|uniref:Uncharacterized protein n=1 Tax=Candidatus Mcinerneyibacterium aminivorans TaxID=2703815 RepID=A0A5D0MD34_9BACT|nr:MAG: hypothetical protein FXF47_03300 [Candidatus Mcinerneyibacterium aminivorans]
MRTYDINLHKRGKKNYLKKRIESKLGKILRATFVITVILFIIFIIVFLGINTRKSQLRKEYNSIVNNNKTKRLNNYEKEQILFLLNRAKKRIILDKVIDIIYTEKPSFFYVQQFNTQNKEDTLVFKVDYLINITNGNKIDSMKRLIKEQIENNKYNLEIEKTNIQKVTILNNNSIQLNITGVVKIYE